MFPSLVKAGDCQPDKRKNNKMTPLPPLKRAVQKPPPPRRLQRIAKIFCEDIFVSKSVFFELIYKELPREKSPNKRRVVRVINVCSEEIFFFREKKLVVGQVQQRGLCPAAKLRGQGDGFVLVGF